MPKDSLKRLLGLFPYFLDKSNVSNFYKSQSVTNELFKDVYNDLFKVHESFRLDKRILVWREQSVPYNYDIHFACTIPRIKSVVIYCNDDIIYEAEYMLDDNVSYLFREVIHKYNSVDTGEVDENDNPINYINHSTYITEHNIDDKITTFKYIYNANSENIIPDEKYHIIIDTFDEIHLEKGYPENDTIQDNVYDHDISLDEFGSQNNIPRKQYLTINEDDYIDEEGELLINELIERYNNTEPSYNNQSTEDDYHYMNRMIKYLLLVQNDYLVVAEIFKLYGVKATLINRERYLLKMFDIYKYDYYIDENADGDKTFVDDWVPHKWEHKDRWGVLHNVLGEYFFVTASTLQPVKKQMIYFYFKLVNSLYQHLNDEYYITISLNGMVIEDNYMNSQFSYYSSDLDELHDNIFLFEAKRSDGSVIDSVSFIVNVRGCNTADFYVNQDSDETIEDGSKQYPFKDLSTAVSKVNGVYNLIAVVGEQELSETILVKESCTIIGCNHAKLIKKDNPILFNISQGKELILQDFIVGNDEYDVEIENHVYTNNNLIDTAECSVIESVDYGVLISDMIEPTSFIQDLKIDGHNIVYTELELNELEKLSDMNNVIQDLNININGHGIDYTLFSSMENEYLQSLPYIDLKDRLNLAGSVKDLNIENHDLISNEYGEVIAWQIKRHSI